MDITKSIDLFQTSSFSWGRILFFSCYLSLFTCYCFLRCVLDSLNDVLIPGAAAEIAIQPVSNLFARRVRIPVDDLRGSHDHARRAVATLKAVTFPEPFLHMMQLTVRGQPFDRGDVGPVRLHREHRARFHRLSIEQHGTCAAEGGLTTDV